MTAYVFRFCRNLRARSCREREDKDVYIGPLNAEEIDRAEEHWVKKAQAGLSTKIAKGEFKTLSLFTDDKGIIRIGGRVDPALVSYDERHAALLPYDHWISMLITRDAHQSGHPGIAATTAKTRRRYWIVKGDKLSKIVKRRCTFCRKMEAQVETQLMAKLPKCRLQPFTPPFMYTSCDYFGPFKVKIGRNKTAKHYAHVPEHQSRSLRTRHRCKYHGISASFEKILLVPRVLGSSNFRQWFPNGECGSRTATNDRRMGQSQAKRILRRQRYEMAVYHPTCPSSEWMF